MKKGEFCVHQDGSLQSSKGVYVKEVHNSSGSSNMHNKVCTSQANLQSPVDTVYRNTNSQEEFAKRDYSGSSSGRTYKLVPVVSTKLLPVSSIKESSQIGGLVRDINCAYKSTNDRWNDRNISKNAGSYFGGIPNIMKHEFSSPARGILPKHRPIVYTDRSCTAPSSVDSSSMTLPNYPFLNNPVSKPGSFCNDDFGPVNIVSQRFSHALSNHRKKILYPLYKSPFQSQTDLVSHLLPYHLVHTSDPTQEQICLEDSELFSRLSVVSKGFENVREKFYRLNAAHLQKGDSFDQSAIGLILSDRLFVQCEGESLNRDKRLALSEKYLSTGKSFDQMKREQTS